MRSGRCLRHEEEKRRRRRSSSGRVILNGFWARGSSSGSCCWCACRPAPAGGVRLRPPASVGGSSSSPLNRQQCIADVRQSIACMQPRHPPPPPPPPPRAPPACSGCSHNASSGCAQQLLPLPFFCTLLHGATGSSWRIGRRRPSRICCWLLLLRCCSFARLSFAQSGAANCPHLRAPSGGFEPQTFGCTMTEPRHTILPCTRDCSSLREAAERSLAALREAAAAR